MEVKRLESHSLRVLLRVRAQLIATRTTLSNQIRGLLKTFGLVLAPGRGKRFEQLVEAGLPQVGTPLRHHLVPDFVATGVSGTQAVRSRSRSGRQSLDRLPRLRSVPGVGSLTAIAYVTMVDNPTRFRRSTDVGAYVGFTPRRYQSGAVDRQGAISKCRDRLVRSLLFEAAAVLWSRVKATSALRARGLQLAARIGLQKARVAVARKLAVLLHHLWVTDSRFCPAPCTP